MSPKRRVRAAHGRARAAKNPLVLDILVEKKEQSLAEIRQIRGLVDLSREEFAQWQGLSVVASVLVTTLAG
jgi:hypothetical protein